MIYSILSSISLPWNFISALRYSNDPFDTMSGVNWMCGFSFTLLLSFNNSWCPWALNGIECCQTLMTIAFEHYRVNFTHVWFIKSNEKFWERKLFFMGIWRNFLELFRMMYTSLIFPIHYFLLYFLLIMYVFMSFSKVFIKHQQIKV